MTSVVITPYVRRGKVSEEWSVLQLVVRPDAFAANKVGLQT